MTFNEALRHAKIYGPSDETRKIICEFPNYARYYALNIDKCPRDDTREAACKDPEDAYFYAKDIDRCPRVSQETTLEIQPVHFL